MPIVGFAIAVVLAPTAGMIVRPFLIFMRGVIRAVTGGVLGRSGSHRTDSVARARRRDCAIENSPQRAARRTLLPEGVMMLNGLTRPRVIQIWIAAVIVAIAGGLAFGVQVTLSTGVLLLASSLVPPAIVLFLWRETPPTVAEVIHSADRRS